MLISLNTIGIIAISELGCLISLTSLIAVIAIFSGNQQTNRKTLPIGSDFLNQSDPELFPNYSVVIPIKFDFPPGEPVGTVLPDVLSDEKSQIRASILSRDGKNRPVIFLIIACLANILFTIIAFSQKRGQQVLRQAGRLMVKKFNGYNPLWRSWRIAHLLKSFFLVRKYSSTESLLSAGLSELGGKVRPCIHGDLL